MMITNMQVLLILALASLAFASSYDKRNSPYEFKYPCPWCNRDSPPMPPQRKFSARCPGKINNCTGMLWVTGKHRVTIFFPNEQGDLVESDPIAKTSYFQTDRYSFMQKNVYNDFAWRRKRPYALHILDRCLDLCKDMPIRACPPYKIGKDAYEMEITFYHKGSDKPRVTVVTKDGNPQTIKQNSQCILRIQVHQSRKAQCTKCRGEGKTGNDWSGYENCEQCKGTGSALYPPTAGLYATGRDKEHEENVTDELRAYWTRNWASENLPLKCSNCERVVTVKDTKNPCCDNFAYQKCALARSTNGHPWWTVQCPVELDTFLPENYKCRGEKPTALLAEMHKMVAAQTKLEETALFAKLTELGIPQTFDGKTKTVCVPKTDAEKWMSGSVPTFAERNAVKDLLDSNWRRRYYTESQTLQREFFEKKLAKQTVLQGTSLKGDKDFDHHVSELMRRYGFSCMCEDMSKDDVSKEDIKSRLQTFWDNRCHDCDGTGWEPNYLEIGGDYECKKCKGTGATIHSIARRLANAEDACKGSNPRC